jgi:hypothetical protein
MEHSAGLACRFGQRRPVANVGDDGGNQTRMAASEPSEISFHTGPAQRVVDEHVMAGARQSVR